MVARSRITILDLPSTGVHPVPEIIDLSSTRSTVHSIDRPPDLPSDPRTQYLRNARSDFNPFFYLFEERKENKFLRFFITSYFLNAQTTVKSRDVARLELKLALPASKSVCLLQFSLKAHFVIFHFNINNKAT